MTGAEANAIVQRYIAEHKGRHVPDERAPDGRAALAFDYGYRQALHEMEMALMWAFLHPELGRATGRATETSETVKNG